MKYAFYTLGCKVNQYETQAMEQMLTAAGAILSAPLTSAADAYIVNTCTVTAVSDKKSRQTSSARLPEAELPAAVVGVCGCYAQTEPEAVEALGVDVVAWLPAGPDGLSGRCWRGPAARDSRPGRCRWTTPCAAGSFERLPAGGLEGRTRAMLKVEDGCVNFCTYCIIPYARGPVRSLPLADAVAAGHAPGRGGLPGDRAHRHRDLLLGPGSGDGSTA